MGEEDKKQEREEERETACSIFYVRVRSGRVHG